uniref:Uncharacterized protein n=1 Tax=Arundo donax TaxID=35708 RepID=A0A0A8YH00_ARUDO
MYNVTSSFQQIVLHDIAAHLYLMEI